MIGVRNLILLGLGTVSLNLQAADGFVKIDKPIDYSHRYSSEKAQFTPGMLSVSANTKRPYTVLVNFHDDSPLNLSNSYDPAKRTLMWGTPYQLAYNQALSTSKHAHDQSALLTSWTGGKLRNNVSFIIFPQKTPLTFLFGGAAPMEDRQDARPGEGAQVRLKSLPAGTIVLTQNLAEVKKGAKGTLNLEQILLNLIKLYNDENPSNPIGASAASDFDYTIKNGEWRDYIRNFFLNVEYRKY